MNELHAALTGIEKSTFSSISKGGNPKQDPNKKVSKFYFGFKIKRDQTVHQKSDVAFREQKIIDWQNAKQEIISMITSRGLSEPLAIVPQNVFNKVLDLLEINDFRDNLSNKGKIIVPPFLLDYGLSPHALTCDLSSTVYRNLPSQEEALLSIIGSNRDKLLSILSNYRKKNHKQGTALKDIPRIDIEISNFSMHYTEKKSVSVFDIDALSFKREHWNKGVFTDLGIASEEYSRYEITKELLKNLSLFKKNLLKEVGDLISCRVNFGDIPSEVEDLLINIKSYFPSWPVRVAADPAFFTIESKDGRDFWEYSIERWKYWKEKQQEMAVLLESVRQKSEVFRKILSTEGIHTDALILNEEMMEIIRQSKDEDPIFYTPVSHKYHHTRYDMVIIWTQCGTSPREKQAVEYLQKLTPEDFEGIKV